MGEHPEATYAALCHEYAPRDPFAEFGHQVIDLNTLRILVQGLPPDSAMHRADPDWAGWKTSDHLLASAIDTLGAIFNMLKAQAEAQAVGHSEYVPPEPIRRPGDEARREQAAKEQAVELEAAKAWTRNIEALTGVGR